MTGRDNIGRSLFTDYLGLQDELTEQELDYLERTRRFVDHEVLPVIGDYWQRAEFPFELIAKMAELGIVGDGIEGYGCPQMSPTASGLINMELSRGDGSLGTFLGVQSGLAMRSIALLGSQEQKQRWLPGMAALEVIGAFALTEPEHGSDSVGLEASLHRDGDAYVLSGRKRWIGNGSIADVVVVWARDTEDGAVKGLLLEKDTPGFQAEVMLGKGSVRAVWQADLTFTDVRVPLDNKLPGANTFKDASVVLASTRNSVAWAALGHAVAAYEVALTYSKERIQFGKPLATKQLVQDKLVRMLAEVTTMQLYCLRLAKLLEAGKLTDTISALAKMNNTRKAREVIAMARDLLGGNGILLENHIIRHMADIEAIYTYEGTADIQTLIVGREITGMSAFT
jgi:glutaryl-CoA dehydrogenase